MHWRKSSEKPPARVSNQLPSVLASDRYSGNQEHLRNYQHTSGKRREPRSGHAK
jgi:hypothetical protein